MTHTVAVGEFEGPLGILLELVERNKLEVTSISVAHITKEYLERIKDIRERSPENVSEFLQLGARLMYIKSLALLPQESAAEQVEEIRQLNLELDEYRRFQEAARLLASRAKRQTWERRAVTKLEPHERPLPDVSLVELSEAFTRALKHLEPSRPAGIIRQHVSLESVAKRLRQRLDKGFQLQTIIDDCRDRMEIVVTFLALLELVRHQEARVTQADQFAPIMVEGVHV